MFNKMKAELEKFADIYKRITELLKSEEISYRELTYLLRNLEVAFSRIDYQFGWKFYQQVVSLSDALSSFKEKLEETSRGTFGFGKALTEGMPFEALGGLGRTVSRVAMALRNWLGIAIPVTVAEMLKTIVRAVEDFNTKLLALREQIPMAFVETGEIMRAGMFAIQQHIEGFAQAMRMASREFLEIFREMRQTGILYVMTEYQRILEAQNLYSQGMMTAREFTGVIADALRELRALAISLGVADRQIVRFTETWSRLLMTRDVEEVQAALVHMQKRAIEGGMGLEQYAKFLEQVVDRTRWYGVNLWELMIITRDWTELIRTGAITVQDFVNVLVNARQQMSPERAGTLFYFLANFSDDPAIRGFLQNIERVGYQPVLAIQYLISTQWEKVKALWGELDEAQRREIFRLLDRLGFVEGGVINWEKVINTTNRIMGEYGRVVERITTNIDDLFLRLYLRGELLHAGYGLQIRSIDDYLVARRLQTEQVIMNVEAERERLQAMREREQILDRGFKALDEFTTVITDVAATIKHVIGDMADYVNRELREMEERERQLRQQIRTLPSGVWAPELSK